MRSQLSLRPAFFLLSFAIIFLYILHRPLDDYDIFTQLTLGLSFLREGGFSFPAISFYGSQSLESLSTNPGWLWQYCFATLYQYFHWKGIRVIHYGLLCTSLLLALYVPLLKGTRANQWQVSAAQALPLGLLCIANNTSVRPQLIALLCFCIVFAMLRQRKLKLWHYSVLLFILLLWQNIHLSVVLALPIVGSRALRRFLCDKDPLPAVTLETTLLLCAVVAAHIGTPIGLGVFSLASENYLITHDIFHNLEWYAFWEYGLTTLPFFSLALAISLFLGWSVRRETPCWLWFLVFVYTSLALFAARFILFWAVVMLPIWTYWLEHHRKKNGGWVVTKLLLGTPSALRFTLAVVSILLLGVSAYKTPTLSPSMPLSCIQHLTSQTDIKRVYSYRVWSGLVSFYSKGRIQVQADGRLYRYPASYWRRYFQEVNGEVPLQQVAKEFAPQAFVLSQNKTEGLVQLLEESEEWARRYEEGECVVFVKST